MPSLRLVLVRLFPVLGGSSHNTSGYQNYGDEYGNKSAVLRSRSKTLETGKPPTQPQHTGIELHKMFVVRYDDEDEASLVRMREAERAVGKSSKGANSTSEVSL